MTAINKLKHAMGLGARSNKYKVMVTPPVGSASSKTLNIMCKTASLPPMDMDEIDIFVQGRKLTISNSQQNGGVVSLTFYDDAKHTIRRTLMEWMEFIDNVYHDNRTSYSHTAYMKDLKVFQLDGNNTPTSEYTYASAYPKAISSTSLGVASSDEIIEISVDFIYQFIKL